MTSSLPNDQSRPLLNEEKTGALPSYRDVSSLYAARWEEEKEKFYSQLRENFTTLTSQWKSGKQEIYELNETKMGQYIVHYEKAFRELFSDPGYEAHVGPTERVGSGQKKIKKLYITLPDCFSM